MAYKIRSAELEIVNPNAIDDLIGYYKVEIYGLLNKMRAQFACAHFGTFERIGHRSILYSATVWTERDGTIAHDYDSEFADDLKALKTGNVDHFN